MWLIYVISAVALGIAAAAAASAVRGARRRRAQYNEAVRLWRETPEPRRREIFAALPPDGELNAPAWFLLGCICLRRHDTREAARAFGMAHHADWRLENAALLTFACLKATDGPGSDIAAQLAATWREMKRPDPLRRREDRLMLDCLAETTPGLPVLSDLGRLAWLVVGPELRPAVAQQFAVEREVPARESPHAAVPRRQRVETGAGG